MNGAGLDLGPVPLLDGLGPALVPVNDDARGRDPWPLDLAPVLAFGVLDEVPCVRPFDVLDVVPPSWPRCRRARR